MSTPEIRERSRQLFIGDAIEVLNRSLDYQKTLASLAWIAVPTIADWCAVDVIENGQLQRLAVAHIDPAKVRLVTELQQRHPFDPEGPSGVARVLRTGKPEMISEITADMIDASPIPSGVKEIVHQLAIYSMICVPLRRGDQTIGAITLVTAESRRRYEADDLALALTLADRASAAIDKAHVFREVERARARAANERDRLVQLVDSSPVAIAILSGPDLVFEIVNERFRAIFGHRDFSGQKQADLDPDGGVYTHELRTVLMTGKHITRRELEVTYDWDGTGKATTRYFDTTCVPMRDPDGVVDGVVSYSLDVSEQVIARRKSEEAKAQAELANRAKDEFLAMLGHELRNPLAPILTALELMEIRDPKAFERERTVINRQVRHVVRLVDDLLDISRITRGSVELHHEDLDLADTITKAIEIASPLLEERHHQLETNVPRGLVVNGDPVRLAQVVANLLTNAAKYTEHGGSVSITAMPEGSRVAVRVRDTGVGIAPEVLPYVFDTFFQAQQSIDRARGGLGIGLAIVRSLVHAHGGDVTASSAGLGKGSEFVVRLPLIEIGDTRAVGAPAGGSRPIRPERILVVDDNADALDLLADALEQRGFETFRAHDAPSALQLAEKVRPQIALVDLGLPVMDGYELARRFRDTSGLETVQLVAVTGYGQASDLEQSNAAGFVAHLVKPISLDAVNATIDELTTHARNASSIPHRTINDL